MEELFAGTTAEVRDYQVRTCAKTVNHLLGPKPVRSVLIDAPTGSGKTVVGLALARLGASMGKRIGWVAMRRNLLSQAAEMDRKFGFGLDEMAYMSMFDKDPQSVDWLFVDEAQHDATPTMARLHSIVRPERVIGLSATPFRTDRSQLAFEKVVREVGIQELIDGGYLSQYDHYTIPSWSPEAVAERYAASPEEWGKSVMFFLTMGECRRAEAALLREGVSCEVVWAGSDREKQIRNLRSGGVQVAISMSLLAEGLDAEELRTAFVRPSGKGPTLQMTGRVLRKLLGCDAKRVVQCGETRYPFTRAASARKVMTLVGDRFLSVVPNENVEKMSRRCLDRLVHSKEKGLPPFLARAQAGRRRIEGMRSRRGHGRHVNPRPAGVS